MRYTETSTCHNPQCNAWTTTGTLDFIPNPAGLVIQDIAILAVFFLAAITIIASFNFLFKVLFQNK